MMRVRGCVLREREGDRVHDLSVLERLRDALNWACGTVDDSGWNTWIETDLFGESWVMIEFDSGGLRDGNLELNLGDGLAESLGCKQIKVPFVIAEEERE